MTEQPDPTPIGVKSVPIDLLEDGLLWLINSTVFHPRGFALQVDTDTGELRLQGDGREPVGYIPKDLHPQGIDVDAKFAAVRDLFERAARENAEYPEAVR